MKDEQKVNNKANLPVCPCTFRRVSYKLHYKAGGPFDVRTLDIHTPLESAFYRSA